MSVVIREFREDDTDAVKRKHAAQNFDYVLPPLDGENFVVRAVLEGRSGDVEMAVLLRRTAETYLLMDPARGTKREKLGEIIAMQREVTKAARARGLNDAHLWMPPELEPTFGKTLYKHFGWKKALWPSYFKEF